MQGIVLAGGMGTRLRPRAPNVPKPMAPIAGRPFLCWLLDRLAEEGFQRVVLSVGYLKAVIMDALGSHHRGIELVYAVEQAPLGTGGAICNAMPLLDPGLPAVWVMNGDTISTLGHRDMYAAHIGASAQLTMALTRVPDASRFGAVLVEADRVAGFAACGAAQSGLINLGSYLMSQSLLTRRDWPERFSFESDVLPQLIDCIPIRPFEIAGWFVDIGVPEDFDRAQLEVPRQLASLAG